MPAGGAADLLHRHGVTPRVAAVGSRDGEVMASVKSRLRDIAELCADVLRAFGAQRIDWLDHRGKRLRRWHPAGDLDR